MIGAGNMGGMMALLFAEYGIEVHIFDPSAESVDHVLEQATAAGLDSKLFHQKDYESLCKSLSSDSPKVFVLSVPHGDVGDKTIDGLEPFLQQGDVIMDASNERWTSTERRQERLKPKGVHFVGMGVSGGYQAARHGPSISPGGSSMEALDLVWPFLTKIAAKDQHGRPCTAKLGVGGCGHYVKMVHNGIEHGMMTVLGEIWGIMTQTLGWTPEEAGEAFERWNKDDKSPLRSNFLVEIASHICRTKDPRDPSKYMLSDIRDTVVQDVCEEEGTGTWTVMEAARLHVSTPVLAVSHMVRVASAYPKRREAAGKAFKAAGVEAGPRLCKTEARTVEGKAKAARELRDATYAGFLSCFVQGMHLVAAADAEHKWGLNYSDVLQLWRGGCIIQSDGIVDMLDEVYQTGEVDKANLLAHARIAQELGGTMEPLKALVTSSLQVDAYVPALSASLEFVKVSTATELPTSLQAAELDFFGHHMYDKRSEAARDAAMGKHHFEWRPARGPREVDEMQ